MKGDAAAFAGAVALSDAVLARAASIGERALARAVMLTSAESCTGGLVAAALTAVPGSSEWFEQGFVTYSNAAKTALLGVPSDLIAAHGAVSAETARAMCEGALARSGAGLAVAVTGIAGPGGGSEQKPVGTVWFAWSGRGATSIAGMHFAGDRAAVRSASVVFALEGLLDRLD